jgi:hypothetical protein
MGKLTAAKALLISLLLHLLFARFTILTFPLEAVALKPTFIFWGSILSQQDLIKLTAQPGDARAMQWNPGELQLIKGSAALRASETGLSKPLFPAITKGEKVSYRSTLEEFQDAPPPSVDPVEKLGIDPQTPARIPLKLNLLPNDQN